MNAFSLNPATQLASAIYHQNLQRDSRYAEVIELMRQLGVDRGPEGRRPAADLLEEAKKSLDQPVIRGGGPVGVGLALRGCIDDTLAFLLRQRSTGQEKVGKAPREKLLSIGRNLGYPGADPASLGLLAAEHEALLNVELDEAKQADLSRKQLGDLFHRGLLFLHALLSFIDKGRLKP